MAKILLIEDDSELSATVAKWLTLERHHVEIASNGSEGLNMVLEGNFDLFVLDVNLPGVTGFEICRQYRSRGGHTPVIMLTGEVTIRDKEEGFDAGADDYLTKPFSMKELTMRINALLRRPAIYRGDLTVGKLTLDPGAHKITKLGVALTLLPVDFALLEFLMRHPGETFSPETLISRVWPTDKYPSLEAVRSAIKRIRKQIDDDESQPSLIETVNKVGYRLLKP